MDFPEFTRLLTSTCTIKKAKETKLATGQKKVEYEVVETDVACYKRILSGTRDITILGRIPTATHKLYISEGHTVEQNNQIIIGTDKYVVREKVIPDKLVDFDNQRHHAELVIEEIKE